MADMIKNGMHGCSRADSYVPPEEPEVRASLERFADRKLGIMFHFGIYSQLGIYESWPLSDGDASWSRRYVDWEDDADTFKVQYRNMNRSFNPVRFQPDAWAAFAKDAGFQYVVFTTKHHDGFCMYDTKLTDYKITDPSCPFSSHKYADVAGEVFRAFRAQGLGVTAYFSKPDWHCPWYWAQGFATPPAASRNPTYDPKKHLELWEKFISFTHAQMLELVRDYGPIDALWLDGGQVRPDNGQDIRMHDAAKKAREIAPGLLFIDRTVGGEYENVITPEQSIPDAYIPVPWESCVTIGTGFSFRFEDEYKSPRTLVNMLSSVVCRGGNLALNIGPQPDGRLPIGAMRSCEGLGAWLTANGDAIYGTRAVPPYEIGSLAFTRKANTVYCINRLEDGETLLKTLYIPWNTPVSSVKHLSSGENVPFTQYDGGVLVSIPDTLVSTNPIAPTFALGI
ncbi:MAG: alpha-L-fucosidase [Clostridiaceae bacterium]|nr:alpha-L-fucosidase [Clostridiaceae bacterium]